MYILQKESMKVKNSNGKKKTGKETVVYLTTKVSALISKGYYKILRKHPSLSKMNLSLRAKKKKESSKS